MIQTVALALTIAAGSVTIAPAAQARPDFSGQWTVEAETPARGGPGRGRGDMGSGWGSTIRVTQSAQQLTVEYAFYTRGDMQPPMKFVYALDGSEAKNVVMAGHGMQEQRSKAVWSGESLAITTVYTFADPATGKSLPATVTQTLSLASPTSLVVEVKRAGVLGGADTTTKTTYRKASTSVSGSDRRR